MDTPREQYDSLLGGKETLPAAVSIMKFISARGQEIAALTEAIEDPQNKHLAFQKMPRHLRRRAMSHNVKRMPRRLQEVHLNQMEKAGLPVKGKRPSRKFRRKPCNLLLEYNRRQRSSAWLETHIWHAKRFHMLDTWGYKLPHFPNDKSFRACYRATAKHCLLQDVSYLNCIELQGAEAYIVQHLSQLTSPECGLTFAAKSFLGGEREGSVMVFRRGAYPFHAIGRVTFMWRPESDGQSRTLWVWCHPAFYGEFLQELVSLFELKPVESTRMEVDQSECADRTLKVSKKKKLSSTKKNVEKTKLETKNIGKLPKLSNGSIVMTLLKDTLNRFRLTGPLAQIVLTEALKFVNIEDFITSEPSGERVMEVDGEESRRSAWLAEFYSNEARLNSLQQQQAFWKSIQNVNSADELPPKMILSSVVLDPRLSMPSTRIKAVYSEVGGIQAAIPAGVGSHSALWDSAVRDTVTHSKMAAAQLNRLRSRALVPGLATPAWLGLHNVSHLPLLLVQKPGTRATDNNTAYGSGWDVILPAGWGMPVWQGLVFRGARVGGLRETQKLTLEATTGPSLPPDTQAGRRLSHQNQVDARQKHFRLPPDKRPNYIKLGIVSPFHCPWEKLLQDWSSGQENKGFYVIRHRGQLDYLRSVLNRTTPNVTCAFSEDDKKCGLVQVGVEMCGRGTVGQCALICALSKRDLKLSKGKSGRGPTEPLHEDVNEESRQTLRQAHLTKLKRLRKKRVKAKRKREEQGINTLKTKIKTSPTEEIVSKQAEIMKELWLPNDVKTVKNSSSRNVMGFVTYGDYSFTWSRTFGYGFVALSALLSSERNKNQVLVRNVNSLQYYVGRLQLIYPV